MRADVSAVALSLFPRFRWAVGIPSGLGHQVGNDSRKDLAYHTRTPRREPGRCVGAIPIFKAPDVRRRAACPAVSICAERRIVIV